MKIKQTEESFQDAVMELAGLYGWLCYHTHDSRRSREGFPDLVLAKGGTVLFAECKTDKGPITDDQIAWLLATNGMIWRPKHWDLIELSLKEGRVYLTERIPPERG